MPSSTFNSEDRAEDCDRVRGRRVPDKPWAYMFAELVFLMTVALGVWELQVRAEGYRPTVRDTPELWGVVRDEAQGVRSSQVVFVGASRTLFDIDLDTVEAVSGVRPVQLSAIGASAARLLGDLAEDPSYAGTTFVGIAPGLASLAKGEGVHTVQTALERRDRLSPADRIGLSLGIELQRRFAFINYEDFSLDRIISQRIVLPEREGMEPFDPVRHFYDLDARRRAVLSSRAIESPGIKERLIGRWRYVMTPPPPPPGGDPIRWAGILDAGWEQILDEFAQHVAAIEARGGRVFFLRLPSTGTVRQLEADHTPRDLYWDRLLQHTGAPGLHFEDEPELAGFDCAEESHLDHHDSVEFTRRLMIRLRARGWI